MLQLILVLGFVFIILIVIDFFSIMIHGDPVIFTDHTYKRKVTNNKEEDV